MPPECIRFGSYCTAHISGQSAAHTTTKHFGVKKAVNKKKSATGLATQSRLEEPALAEEFCPAFCSRLLGSAWGPGGPLLAASRGLGPFLARH